ncbi:transposase [Streptomyces sp. NPDC002467]|uniref:transposase n=1 Tax=Streptomyces sp. NPDC002467 TaxID=3364647 RepID=UPI0036AC9E62
MGPNETGTTPERSRTPPRLGPTQAEKWSRIRPLKPLKVITTAANVNDVTQTLALVDGIPPVSGRPGRPRRRPEALFGDKGYDSNPNRDELRKRRILPVISRKGAPNIKAWASSATSWSRPSPCSTSSKRLAVRWERRTELHDAFVSLACSLICWRRLTKPDS